MTTILKIFLNSMVILLVLIVLLVVYLTFGASVLGPKIEVSEVCASINSAMSLPNATSIVDEYEGMDATLIGDDEVLQISKLSRGWICICRANLEKDSSGNLQVASVDEVFCSD